MCVTHASAAELDAWLDQLDATAALTAPAVADADLTPAEVEELFQADDAIRAAEEGDDPPERFLTGVWRT